MSGDKKSSLSVRQTFVQEIERQILSEELKPGDRLPTSRELCSKMGVSLTIVNAGVAELANKGFVEVKPRHGVYVTDYRTSGNPAILSSIVQYNGGRLNAHDIRSFCETRAALDPMAAELAVERATEKDLEEWGKQLEQIRLEQDRKKLCVLIPEYIYRLYRMSDNFLLTVLYHCTMEPQQRMYQQFIEKNGTDAVIRNAEEVFRFVSERNAAAAAACMREAMRLPLEGTTAII